MIRQLLIGIARALFAASILVSMFAIGLGYLAYRVIRFAFRGDKPYPVRDAAFGALMAGVVLAKAVQAEQARRPPRSAWPGPSDEPALDVDHFEDTWTIGGDE